MVLNLGLVLEKFSGRSTVPEYSWKFEIRAGSNRLYGRFDPVLQNSGFLVHSKFSDFRSELNLDNNTAVPVLNLVPVPVYPGYGCVPPGWTNFLQNSCLGSNIECTCAGQDPRYRIQTLWRTVPSTDEVPILPQKGTDFAESSVLPSVIKMWIWLYPKLSITRCGYCWPIYCLYDVLNSGTKYLKLAHLKKL